MVVLKAGAEMESPCVLGVLGSGEELSPGEVRLTSGNSRLSLKVEGLSLQGQSVQDLFAMTPYYWNTPADGAARLAACESLTTEIGFRFLVYKKE